MEDQYNLETSLTLLDLPYKFHNKKNSLHLLPDLANTHLYLGFHGFDCMMSASTSNQIS